VLYGTIGVNEAKICKTLVFHTIIVWIRLAERCALNMTKWLHILVSAIAITLFMMLYYRVTGTPLSEVHWGSYTVVLLLILVIPQTLGTIIRERKNRHN